MKFIITICLSLFISFVANAQDGTCHTKLSKEQITWLKHFQQNELHLAQKNKSVPYYIPVVAHLVGKDDGTGRLNITTLFTIICELNIKFKPVNFVFYLDEINLINSTNFYIDGSSNDAFTLMGIHTVPNKLNYFFTYASPGLCGYFTPFPDCIMMVNSCSQGGNTTLAHETGHYFSLPHTFSGFENGNIPAQSDQEMVSGGNCTTAGDGFCDTPADYIYNRWNCPYTGTQLDAWGQAYNPDPTLYMSYSSDACQNRFSGEQILAMQANVQSQRASLVNNPPSNLDTSIAVVTNLILPIYYATDVIPNDAHFYWNNVGAEKYLLQIFSLSNNALLYQKYTVDTSATINSLAANSDYRWSVTAINRAKPCASTATAKNIFSTTNFTDVNDLKETIEYYTLPNILQENNECNLIVKHSNITTVNYNLYNLQGQLIYSNTVNNVQQGQRITILPNAHSGFYLLKIKDNYGEHNYKIIVQ